ISTPNGYWNERAASTPSTERQPSSPCRRECPLWVKQKGMSALHPRADICIRACPLRAISGQNNAAAPGATPARARLRQLSQGVAGAGWGRHQRSPFLGEGPLLFHGNPLLKKVGMRRLIRAIKSCPRPRPMRKEMTRRLYQRVTRVLLFPDKDLVIFA